MVVFGDVQNILVIGECFSVIGESFSGGRSNRNPDMDYMVQAGGF